MRVKDGQPDGYSVKIIIDDWCDDEEEICSLLKSIRESIQKNKKYITKKELKSIEKLKKE